MGTKKTPKKAPAKVVKKTVAPKAVAKVVVPPPEPFEPDMIPDPIVPEPVAVAFQHHEEVLRVVTGGEPEKAPFVPTLWRLTLGTDTWHFHPECSRWPTDNYKERTSASIRGVPCVECQTRSTT